MATTRTTTTTTTRQSSHYKHLSFTKLFFMGWAAGLVLQLTRNVTVMFWIMVVGKIEADHPRLLQNHIIYNVISFLMAGVYAITNIALLSVFATSTSTTKEVWWSIMWQLLRTRQLPPFEQQDGPDIGIKKKKANFRRLMRACISFQAGITLGPFLTVVAIQYVMLGMILGRPVPSFLTHVLLHQLLAPLFLLLIICSEMPPLDREQQEPFSSVTENSSDQEEEEDTTLLIV
jgi:ABC-type long-subunit fatty acid transport system fused permease/ATPase subunit